ncbi:MAG: hypothetical protein R3E98_14140 [Gemmatimonadota bacterium]
MRLDPVPPSRSAPARDARRCAPPTAIRLSPSELVRVEQALLPALLAGHPSVGPAEIDERRDLHPVGDGLVEVLLEGSEEDVDALLAGWVHDGVRVDTLLLETMPAAARRLGRMWERDQIGFGHVALGLARLQRQVRRLEARFSPDVPHAFVGRVLVGTPTGEVHTLAAILFGEVLRRRGWEVLLGPPFAPSWADAFAVPGEVDVVALSASSVSDETLRAEVALVRRSSRRPGLRVIAGGRAVGRTSDVRASLDLDAIAYDFLEGTEAAQRMLGTAPEP